MAKNTENMKKVVDEKIDDVETKVDGTLPTGEDIKAKATELIDGLKERLDPYVKAAQKKAKATYDDLHPRVESKEEKAGDKPDKKKKEKKKSKSDKKKKTTFSTTDCLIGIAAIGTLAGLGYMAYQNFSNSDSVDFRIN